MSQRFATIMEHIEFLVRTESDPPSEAYETIRNAIISDFIAHGYSEKRALEVLHEMEEHVRQHLKPT